MPYDYEIGAFLSEPNPASVSRAAKWIKNLELKFEQEKSDFKWMCNNKNPSTIIAALRHNGWSFQQRHDLHPQQDDSQPQRDGLYLEFRKGNYYALFGYSFYNRKAYITLSILIDKIKE